MESIINTVRTLNMLLQDPFNMLKYEIIGDDAAPSYFRIEPTSGRIVVNGNLESDGTRMYSVSFNFLSRRSSIS